MEVERIQAVVLTGQVQHADTDFGVTAREAVAGPDVVLPEIIAGPRGGVAGVLLVIPRGFPLSEKAARMLVVQRERDLMELRVFVLFLRAEGLSAWSAA